MRCGSRKISRARLCARIPRPPPPSASSRNCGSRSGNSIREAVIAKLGKHHSKKTRAKARQIRAILDRLKKERVKEEKKDGANSWPVPRSLTEGPEAVCPD